MLLAGNRQQIDDIRVAFQAGDGRQAVECETEFFLCLHTPFRRIGRLADGEIRGLSPATLAATGWRVFFDDPQDLRRLDHIFGLATDNHLIADE